MSNEVNCRSGIVNGKAGYYARRSTEGRGTTYKGEKGPAAVQKVAEVGRMLLSNRMAGAESVDEIEGPAFC